MFYYCWQSNNHSIYTRYLVVFRDIEMRVIMCMDLQWNVSYFSSGTKNIHKTGSRNSDMPHNKQMKHKNILISLSLRPKFHTIRYILNMCTIVQHTFEWITAVCIFSDAPPESLLPVGLETRNRGYPWQPRLYPHSSVVLLLSSSLLHCIVGYLCQRSVQCLHTVIFTGNSMHLTYYWVHTKVSDILIKSHLLF